ncbi:hypothetical protein [Flavobacterium sp. 120]|uniref:hypothetical protein n=1 Tax=Flavobacterium sp. 120 TaxID=2135626 RepID=UPI000EADE121|nr:hypothetical protein [Flavobacterium sp. 120]RKS14050.1 hypothetical protein C8C87_1305 [Flavobacterium sp. 120]
MKNNTIRIKYLLKFGQKQDMENLFNKGEVYMNTIKLFQELDKQGVGDKLEGTFEISNFKEGKLTLEIPDNPITLNPKKIQLRKKLKGHIGNIYSTYALSDKLLQRKAIHRIDKRMLLFGTHCIIIKDVEKFISSILEKLDDIGFSYSHNLVKYNDYNKNNHDLTLFDKSHTLSYQKEHRIIVYTKTDEPVKFEIGPMHEYAEIHSTEDVIKNAIFR